MSVIDTCRARLLEMKSDIIHQMHTAKNEFNAIDMAHGDESDQAVAHQEEHRFLTNQSRMKTLLREIEFALARIENGTYGLCEETNEKIESERLLALPWTRLSIEGAEIREEMLKKNQKRSS